jgi:hypothetical protein
MNPTSNPFFVPYAEEREMRRKDRKNNVLTHIFTVDHHIHTNTALSHFEASTDDDGSLRCLPRHRFERGRALLNRIVRVNFCLPSKHTHVLLTLLHTRLQVFIQAQA